mmetsp:Transcript_7798/g.19272  ORF Transcript_7798/g.19272 Transcript_7798/m.19272 type:complete len:427 (-) Transcript_7798:501-1781(-)
MTVTPESAAARPGAKRVRDARALGLHAVRTAPMAQLSSRACVVGVRRRCVAHLCWCCAAMAVLAALAADCRRPWSQGAEEGVLRTGFTVMEPIPLPCQSVHRPKILQPSRLPLQRQLMRHGARGGGGHGGRRLAAAGCSGASGDNAPGEEAVRATVDTRKDPDQEQQEFNDNRLNLPIVITFALLLLSLLFRQDAITIFALYHFSSSMEANWVVESAHVLARLPFDLLSEYGDVAIAQPVLTKACTSGVAYMLGDVIAQVFEGRRRIAFLDLSRSARNAVAGFVLHGPGLHLWICFLEGPFTDFIGGSEEWWAIAAKIFLDQTIFAGVLNTLYALLLGAMAAQPLGEVLDRTRKTLLPAMFSSWRFWPLVHLVTYSPITPIEFKVLWNDVAEIVWVAILSVIANDDAGTAKKKNKQSNDGDLVLAA